MRLSEGASLQEYGVLPGNAYHVFLPADGSRVLYTFMLNQNEACCQRRGHVCSGG
mgnify:CR=1 FL=1